ESESPTLEEPSTVIANDRHSGDSTGKSSVRVSTAVAEWRGAGPNRPGTMARAARRPRTADGGPSGPLRNVPPPSERWPRASGGPERTGKGAETTQLALRMIRQAVTLARDLVRRRHPTGASPSRRIAPGRTLSPMPSEQKGAYGGHLALFCHFH